MNDRPRLWGIGTTRTYRAHHALIERGIDYETVPIRTRTADQERTDFRRVAVSGKVPCLEIDGLEISESAAIARSVMTRDQPPRAAGDQAFIDQWSFFILTELDATALYVLRRHEGLPEIYGEAEAACQAARDYVLRQVNSLDEKLMDGRDTLWPVAFSELDIFLLSIVDWSRLLSLELPERTATWAATMRQRESSRRAREVNYIT